MAIGHEVPNTADIPEKPQKFPIEQLEATFAIIDIKEIATYQENIEPSELLRNPLPPEFAGANRQNVPLFTYNVSRYSDDIEKIIENDPVVIRIKSQQTHHDHERKCALRARRSVIALQEQTKQKIHAIIALFTYNIRDVV